MLDHKRHGIVTVKGSADACLRGRTSLDERAQVIERDYEGYVAKGRGRRVRGRATRRWLKVKHKDWTVEEDH